MIRGLHGLLYSSDANATRAFLRDAVKLPNTDSGDGWLIFDLPEGDLGVHPIDHGGTAGQHNLSFYCDDIEGTVAGLKARGVTFKDDIADQGYGLVTHFTMPGGIEVQLYEPRYTKNARAPSRTASRSGAKKKAPAKKKKAPAKKPAKKKLPKKSAKRR